MTTTNYTVTVELDQPAEAAVLTRAVEALEGHHPAAGRSRRGRAEIIVTVSADHVHGATMTALGLVALHQLGDPVAVHTQTTADHDRDLGLEPIPELLSVTEVAEQLGVTRTAVQARIDSGSLPAQRIGKAWAVPASWVLQHRRRGTAGPS